MLKGKLFINLPSAETDRKMTPLEWIKSMFGSRLDLASGKEEITVGTIALIDGIVEGFRNAGVTNVICFLADKKVIYNDVNNVENDIDLITEAAVRVGLLDRPFRELHLVFDHHQQGIHSIIDVKVRNQVLLGDEEVEVDFSGRIEALHVNPGESAQEYAERIQAFTADEGNLNAYRLSFQQQIETIASSLQKKLIGSEVRTERVDVKLIRPGAKEIANFAKLKFGKNAESGGYRSVPTHQRQGAYADPFYYYYYDPFYSFTTYLLLGSMIHHHSWHSADVSVVDPNGAHLFSGNEASEYKNDNWGSDAISYSGDGGVVVSDSVVEQANDTAASDHWGSSSTDSSYGSESDSYGSSDSGDFGGSDFSSSDSGSSCSSSSCGSSCGGSSCSSCGSN